MDARIVAGWRPQEARRHVLAAIEINPDYHQAHLNLGVLLADEGDASRAGTHFRKAAESDVPEIREAAQQALAELAGREQN